MICYTNFSVANFIYFIYFRRKVVFVTFDLYLNQMKYFLTNNSVFAIAKFDSLFVKTITRFRSGTKNSLNFHK